MFDEAAKAEEDEEEIVMVYADKWTVAEKEEEKEALVDDEK